MAYLLTRPEFRDNIRRDLEIVPPIDTGLPGVLPGQQPVNAPYPTNAQINMCLQQAVSDINREVGWSVTQIPVAVSASPSSAVGPSSTSLATVTSALPVGFVNDIKRVLWQPSGSSALPTLLTPANRDSLDRGLTNPYYALSVGMPLYWWVEGYVLYLSPAPSEDGTLTLTAGIGIIGLQGDQDVLTQVPSDYQYVVEYQGIVRLSKLATLDVEARERAQMFSQDAERGILQLKAWIEGQKGPVQNTLGFASYRGGYGTRRTVR